MWYIKIPVMCHCSLHCRLPGDFFYVGLKTAITHKWNSTPLFMLWFGEKSISHFADADQMSITVIKRKPVPNNPSSKLILTNTHQSCWKIFTKKIGYEFRNVTNFCKYKIYLDIYIPSGCKWSNSYHRQPPLARILF